MLSIPQTRHHENTTKVGKLTSLQLYQLNWGKKLNHVQGSISNVCYVSSNRRRQHVYQALERQDNVRTQ